MQRLAFFFLAPVLVATLGASAALPVRPADGTYAYSIDGVPGLTESTVVIRQLGGVVSTIETVQISGDRVVAETDYDASTLLPTHYRLRQHGQTLDVVFADGSATLVTPSKTYRANAGTSEMAMGDGLIAYRIMLPAILAARAGRPISIFSINGGVVTTIASAAAVVGGLSYRQTSYTTATVAATPVPAPAVATPYPMVAAQYTNRDVSFASSGEAIIAGTLSTPRGSTTKRFPAFVFVHGSGPGTRDGGDAENPTFLELGNALANAGFAVLRYDKRGIGKSTGVATESWKVLGDDARAAVAFLRRQPDVDPHRIYLLGHSEGGEIVPLIAPSIHPALAGVVLLAGPAVSMRRVLDEQSSRMSPGMLPKLQAAFRDYDGLEPTTYITKVAVPMLVLQGSRDLQVLPKDLPPLVAAAHKAHRTLAVAVLDGDDHLFIRLDPSHPDDFSEYHVPAPIDPRVARYIEAWAAVTAPM